MRILAIDVGERELRVASAVRAFGAVRLGAVERIAFADRAELAAALERLAASRPQAIVTALPAALVTHRILTFPFRGRHRLAATVPFELLGQLPAAPDDPVVAFERLARTESGTVVLAAVARRADVDASLEPLVAAGLAPARVDPAPLPVWNLVPAAAGDTAAALGLLALVLGALDLGLVRYDLSRRDAALRAAIARTAGEALPGTRLVAPRAQLEAAVASALRQRTRLGDGTSILEVLRELSTRVPGTVSLDLDQLTIDGDSLDLRGRAASFDTLEALRRALASPPFLTEVTADETRATVDGRGVEFRLRAARRPSGASS